MISPEGLLSEHRFVLGEGSMYERLRRHPGLEYDPSIAHAGFIYDKRAAQILADVHREYLEVGRRHDLPMLVTAGTWRASIERIQSSAFRGCDVNQDHLAFIREIVDGYPAPVIVGGVLGPRGDAYRPREALRRQEARRFHAAQSEALADGADVLMAMTLPALSEALGLSEAMAATGTPYLVSFVIRDTGDLLDGTPIADAINTIDDAVDVPPIGFMLNCVHPSIVAEALTVSGHDRVIGMKVNAVALTPEALEDAAELLTGDPRELARSSIQTAGRHGIRLIAGCCGTGTEHMETIASASISLAD